MKTELKINNSPNSFNRASPGKIFIGGLSKDTSYNEFNQHFGKYGDIIDSVIMMDRFTGQPRGFGFITYANPSVVDKVIEETHVLNGKQVEIKRTIPKGSADSKDFKTKKIFVGGIPTSISEDELQSFFSKYGKVVERQIMRDHESNRSRGFGFVMFDSEEVVDQLVSNGNMIEMAGKQVEIKKAEPKKASNPTLSSKFSNPAFISRSTNPAFSSRLPNPAFSSRYSNPAFSSSYSNPAFSSSYSNPTFTSSFSDPTLVSRSSNPTYDTRSLNPTYDSRFSNPYVSRSANPTFASRSRSRYVPYEYNGYGPGHYRAPRGDYSDSYGWGKGYDYGSAGFGEGNGSGPGSSYGGSYGKEGYGVGSRYHPYAK